MLILPAIDLREGKCVRLLHGRFDEATTYGDPCAQLGAFAGSGATWAHVVDLDGARLGRPEQHALIAEMVGVTKLKLQCGGGVRTRVDAEALLDGGASRVVVGSTAARDPEGVRAWIKALGVERVCLALDVRAVGDRWEVAVDGWVTGAGKTLEQVLERYEPGAVRHVLVTDVSRDGAMTGPNVALIERLVKMRPDIAFQASGGVAQIGDLVALRAAGAAACIVGRALYERRFTLEAALAI